MLRIGRIAYTNCTPIFHALAQLMPLAAYQCIDGVPAALNAMLRQGLLDICPSSSIEYARHPDQYYLLPQIAISSNGAVQSVLLFSPQPIETLDNVTILLSAESATSVALLKILMKQRYNCNCYYRNADTGSDISDLPLQQPLLLIGDNALKASQRPLSGYRYDLGKLWQEWTGTPFVFALWICTVDAVSAHWHELCYLNETLQRAKQTLCGQFEQIADQSPETAWMGRAALIDYWRHAISYDLDQPQRDGLQLFYEKAWQLDLIAQNPALRFLPAAVKSDSI